MVAGGAKAKFEGLMITISLPNVIVGPDHSVSPSKSTPRLLVPCSTDVGMFQVEVGMVLNKKPTDVATKTETAGAIA